jgi:hypothetical protein
MKEAHPCCVAALSFTAVCSVILFFFPGPFFWLADQTTRNLFGL